MKKYDFIIVGSGLFGSTCAYELTKRGLKVLVLEKRDHIGGNIYTKNIEGINVHVYGAHIFHTSDENIWKYINHFATFNDYINSPIANYHGELYHLPFNMNTFTEIWNDVKTPEDAKKHIEDEIKNNRVDTPSNLEEQAINLVGVTIYKKLIKEYTEKQWGKDCKDLPASIIKRLPVRFTFDNNYFNDKYQGIPVGGYTQIIEKMLKGIDIQLNTNFLCNKERYLSMAKKIIFTGPIDEYYEYCFGHLEYRTVRFENELLNQEDYQGTAVVNYTSHDVPYTRIIEHKYFEFGTQNKTYVSKEYPIKYELGMEPFYTINDDKNTQLYKKYKERSLNDRNVIFCGRLGQYQYFDMDDTIIEALKLVNYLVK